MPLAFILLLMFMDVTFPLFIPVMGKVAICFELPVLAYSTFPMEVKAADTSAFPLVLPGALLSVVAIVASPVLRFI